MLYGAIFGDIAGSTHEFEGVKTYGGYRIVEGGSMFTDDTICTIAIADWLMNKDVPLDQTMQKWCMVYPTPMGGYGGSFAKWIISEKPKPYNSFGNGAAMRVSPVGWAFNTIESVLENAKKTAMITHNHSDGIKGAESVALAIYLLRNGYSKKYVREEISYIFGYDLDLCVNDLHKWKYYQKETCQETVPEAFVSFFDSVDFESCLRNAFWCNKDTDTIGAIAGSLAEAYYGVTDEVKNVVEERLDRKLLGILRKFNAKYSGTHTLH